jgi:hypothetical protein
MIRRREALRLVREYLQAQEVLKQAQNAVKEKRDHLVDLAQKGEFSDLPLGVVGSEYAGWITFQRVTGSYTLDRELVKFFLMRSLYPHIQIEYPLTPGDDRTICTSLTQAGYMKQGPDELKVWATPPTKFRK